MNKNKIVPTLSHEFQLIIFIFYYSIKNPNLKIRERPYKQDLTITLKSLIFQDSGKSFK